MPGMNGLDAAREILTKDPAARILFLTTFSDQAYIEQAMRLGTKGISSSRMWRRSHPPCMR